LSLHYWLAFCTPALSLYDGDAGVRRSRVNDEFSPDPKEKIGVIPRATKFYDPLADAARFMFAVSEAAGAVLQKPKGERL
jgi:hypothetical protein